MDYSTSGRTKREKQSFTNALIFLINHRGPDTEEILVQALSLKRLTSLLGGAEPTFRETEGIARTLGVPISAFQNSIHTAAPELEIAFAEIMYECSRMSKMEREEIAQKIIELVHPNAGDAVNILQFKKIS